MTFIRWILGKIILFLNAVFSPRGVKRSEEAQKSVDEKATHYALYQFEACPFCVKVRRAMKRQSVNIELRDAKMTQYIVKHWSKVAVALKYRVFVLKKMARHNGFTNLQIS